MLSINSYQSLGAVDGPGVRFVVFMQGCNFKCKYCHNPETLSFKTENMISKDALVSKIERYKSFIFDKGGVTFSGGEPLCQAEKLIDVFKTLKEKGYHIALDTNGSILNDSVKKLLDFTDLVLLDLKMPDNDLYNEYTGFKLDHVMFFFRYLNEINKKTWIRQVIIKGVNDTLLNINFLKEIKKYKNVEKIELLPFRKLCETKYQQMNIGFPMKKFDETDGDTIQKLYNLL